VLVALGPTVAQAQAIREQAQQGARTLLEEAARQVQAILARAWAPQARPPDGRRPGDVRSRCPGGVEIRADRRLAMFVPRLRGEP
jgi:hypothetical protein